MGGVFRLIQNNLILQNIQSPNSISILAPCDYEDAFRYILLATALQNAGYNVKVLASNEHRQTIQESGLISHVPIHPDDVEQQLRSDRDINEAMTIKDRDLLFYLTKQKCKRIARQHCSSIVQELATNPPSLFIDGNLRGYFGSYAKTVLRIPSVRVDLKRALSKFEITESASSTYSLSWPQLDNAMISLDCESLKLTGLAYDDDQKLPLLIYSGSVPDADGTKNAANVISECVARSHKEDDSASVFDIALEMFGYSTDCAEVVLSSIFYYAGTRFKVAPLEYAEDAKCEAIER